MVQPPSADTGDRQSGHDERRHDVQHQPQREMALDRAEYDLDQERDDGDGRERLVAVRRRA